MAARDYYCLYQIESKNAPVFESSGGKPAPREDRFLEVCSFSADLTEDELDDLSESLNSQNIPEPHEEYAVSPEPYRIVSEGTLSKLNVTSESLLSSDRGPIWCMTPEYHSISHFTRYGKRICKQVIDNRKANERRRWFSRKPVKDEEPSAVLPELIVSRNLKQITRRGDDHVSVDFVTAPKQWETFLAIHRAGTQGITPTSLQEKLGGTNSSTKTNVSRVNDKLKPLDLKISDAKRGPYRLCEISK